MRIFDRQLFTPINSDSTPSIVIRVPVLMTILLKLLCLTQEGKGCSRQRQVQAEACQMIPKLAGKLERGRVPRQGHARMKEKTVLIKGLDGIVEAFCRELEDACAMAGGLKVSNGLGKIREEISGG